MRSAHLSLSTQYTSKKYLQTLKKAFLYQSPSLSRPQQLALGAALQRLVADAAEQADRTGRSAA